MKIRYKITLWITATGVLAGLLFSVIVFYEMLEQPYRLIDSELDTVARMVTHLSDSARQHKGDLSAETLPIDPHKYWIKLFDDHLNVLFKSALTAYTELPLYNKNKHGYIVRTTIPKDRIDLEQDACNEVTFRVKTSRIAVQNRPYLIQIGKPIEKLDEETLDLVQGMVAGLVAALLVLLGLSYVAAGKILKPVGIINRRVREINEKSLNQRIPTGKSHDELYELSDSLNRMFDRLQYSFDQQKQFIADAAHELKSPVTLLLLSLEDAVQRPDLPEAFKYRLIRQTDVLRRMGRLVKNLLDLSALELKETLNFQIFDLPDLVKSILEEYEPIFAAQGIEVTVNMAPTLEFTGDRDALQRVLINLVDNAVKYNRQAGKIKLEVSQENSAIRMSLFNTGAGIPRTDIDRVFEQFYRVEKSRSPQQSAEKSGIFFKIIQNRPGTNDTGR
jgi:signal transduction histidine kinase